MVEAFVAQLRPDIFLSVAFLALIIVELVGFWAGHSIGGQHADDTTAALTTALAAIFSIVALVLSFSFSFSLSRYEQRRELVVQEANAIGTAYLRASVLSPDTASRYRELLRRYIAVRIDAYQHDADISARERDEAESGALQERFWAIVSATVRTNPQSLGSSLLMQVTNDVIDLSAEQRAALAFRFSGLALVFILFVTAVGALSLGLAFGYGNMRSWFIALAFAVLLGWLSFTVIDLDTPQAGFARVNLSPLYDQQQSMVPSSAEAR